jgi:regulator of cell morphogenesis and NO signaling
MNLSTTRTVRELAIEIPNATRTFEKLGIDYCCGGSKSLSDACLHAHVSVDGVVLALEQGSNSDRRQKPICRISRTESSAT